MNAKAAAAGLDSTEFAEMHALLNQSSLDPTSSTGISMTPTTAATMTPPERADDGTRTITEILESYGFDGSWVLYVTEKTSDFLQVIHDQSGLPWWASIGLVVFFVRPLITLPLSAYSQLIISRMMDMKQALTKWQETLKYHVAFNSKRKGKSFDDYGKILGDELKTKQKSLLKEYKCHPAKVFFMPFVQIPLWVSVSFVSMYVVCVFLSNI